MTLNVGCLKSGDDIVHNKSVRLSEIGREVLLSLERPYRPTFCGFARRSSKTSYSPLTRV